MIHTITGEQYTVAKIVVENDLYKAKKNISKSVYGILAGINIIYLMESIDPTIIKKKGGKN